jgi:short-subunit dehydrogenase
MTQRALILGANGGIGSSCVRELNNQGYDTHGVTSRDLDLNFPERIFNFDLSGFDLLVNCTGHSQGTYLGFLKNSWQNQLGQITVNYISNLFLLKHYANSRSKGKYVWISTSLLSSGKRPFHSVYVSSKQASKTAIDLIRTEATHIDILEVNVGPTKTGFRHRNFCGTKTQAEVNSMYDQESSHSPDYVAEQIVSAVKHNYQEIKI